MDKQDYKMISKRVASTSMLNVKQSLETLLQLEVLTQTSTVADIIKLCCEFDEVEVDNYKSAKLEQNYGGNL